MTTTADTILAIDLGRFKSVACVYSRSSRHHAFRTIDSHLLAEHPGSLVVIEACANAGWVHDQAVAAGHTVKVANTAAEAWKFQHLKRKTDHDDAKRLAELEAIGQLPTVVLADCVPDEIWRGLLNLAVVEYRFLLERIAEAEKRLDAISATDPATQLLESIPGVGPRTAEAVSAHLGDAKRFANAKQVGSYAGLVPKQYQSGTTDRKGRITRRGPAVLRKLLVECAWVMLRYNSWARAVYARLTAGGTTRKKPAIVALARKLLVRCWAMLRDGKRWKSDPVLEVAGAT